MGTRQFQLAGVVIVSLIGAAGTVVALTEPDRLAPEKLAPEKMAVSASPVPVSAVITSTQSRPAAAPHAPTAETPVKPPPPVTASTTVPPGAYFAEKAKRLLPAVVNISTSSTAKPDPTSAQIEPQSGDPSQTSPFDEFFKDFMDKKNGTDKAEAPAKPQKSVALGSGFIIDPEGFVVTNNHVVADADEITVILQNDTQLKAELVGRDPVTDLALLKVKTSRKLPSVAWGDSDKIRVGDWALAVGNPFGLGGTLTAGLISGRARAINNGGPYDEFLQTDASINRGNSGGPLFDLKGQVVGINAAIFSPSGGSIGLGFAIPSNLAQGVIKQLKDTGKVHRGWLGLRVADASSDMVKVLARDNTSAVLVGAVVPHSPASTAGIRPGDLITAINGTEAKNPPHFLRLVGDSSPGSELTLGIVRRATRQTVDIKVSEAVEDPPARQTTSDDSAPTAPAPPITKILGVQLTPVTPDLKQKYQLGDETGMVVIGAPPSVAGEAYGLEAGDGILEEGQRLVHTPGELVAGIDAARRSGKKTIFLLVERKGDLRYISLRLDRGVG